MTGSKFFAHKTLFGCADWIDFLIFFLTSFHILIQGAAAATKRTSAVLSAPYSSGGSATLRKSDSVQPCSFGSALNFVALFAATIFQGISGCAFSFDNENGLSSARRLLKLVAEHIWIEQLLVRTVRLTIGVYARTQ